MTDDTPPPAAAAARLLSFDEAFGQVESVSIIKDTITGVPRGFGFVDMPAKAEAQSAISGLSGKELKGQAVNINEARPRSEGRGRGRHVE